MAEPVSDLKKPEPIESLVGRALKAFDEAEGIIVDLALLYDPHSTRDLRELVIAAREWIRKHGRSKKG